MGTWGTGNFDSDGALDYIGELTEVLYNRIEATFADEAASCLDEDGEAVIVPSIAVWSVLCAQCHAVPPEATTVAAWKTKYLAIFDDQSEGYYLREGHQEQRRAILVQTFDTLEEQARTFWGDE